MNAAGSKTSPLGATNPLEYTNCCQPLHTDGFAAPLQAAVTKKFALSWSEKVAGRGGGLGFGVCARRSGAVNNAVNTARPSAIIARRDPALFHEFVFNGLVVAGVLGSR